MGIPAFLARKLYKRGSLRETADGRFAFTLQNPLGSATIIAPPRFTVNGVRHGPEDYDVRLLVPKNEDLDAPAISEDHPFSFPKGSKADFFLAGSLLRGANRIHLIVETKEFGTIDMLVEDREADYCELPGAAEEE